MLERWLPNFYGWLIWGGGLNQIRRTLVVLLVTGFLVAVFFAGRWTA